MKSNKASVPLENCFWALSDVMIHASFDIQQDALFLKRLDQLRSDSRVTIALSKSVCAPKNLRLHSYLNEDEFSGILIYPVKCRQRSAFQFAHRHDRKRQKDRQRQPCSQRRGADHAGRAECMTCERYQLNGSHNTESYAG